MTGPYKSAARSATMSVALIFICGFADNNDVEVHGFYDRAAGPHTWGNFEVLFTR